MVPLPAEVMCPPLDDGVPGSASDEDDDDLHDAEELTGLGVASEDIEDRPDADPLTPLQIAVIVLDWMHTNKVTNVATNQIWKAIRALLPGVLVDTPSFRKIHKIVTK